jgi:hypothetical protein
MDMPANAGIGEGDLSAGVMNFKSDAKQRKQQRHFFFILKKNKIK